VSQHFSDGIPEFLGDRQGLIFRFES